MFSKLCRLDTSHKDQNTFFVSDSLRLLLYWLKHTGVAIIPTVKQLPNEVRFAIRYFYDLKLNILFFKPIYIKIYRFVTMAY
jgi:hypothetical protein